VRVKANPNVSQRRGERATPQPMSIQYARPTFAAPTMLAYTLPAISSANVVGSMTAATGSRVSAGTGGSGTYWPPARPWHEFEPRAILVEV
jgi:hypothetical protein